MNVLLYFNTFNPRLNDVSQGFTETLKANVQKTP